MYRIHVDGDKGEAPMTYVQRKLTGKLNPGEAPFPGVKEILSPIMPYDMPHPQDVRKFLLSHLYDLSAPGKYTVYAEVQDPISQGWLRTNSVTFQVVEPKQ